MNIFYLDKDPKVCAQMHVDKHCIKMILEYAQLLSTAHRILDGTVSIGLGKTGRKQTRYVLPDDRESVLYSATHLNHPSAVWCRQSAMNYHWLYTLLVECCKEYTYRYGKIHKCESSGLVNRLRTTPTNINGTKDFTEPTPAMPEDVKVAGDSIKSYRNYYINNKTHLATWSGKVNSRNQPEWFNA